MALVIIVLDTAMQADISCTPKRGMLQKISLSVYNSSCNNMRTATDTGLHSQATVTWLCSRILVALAQHAGLQQNGIMQEAPTPEHTQCVAHCMSQAGTCAALRAGTQTEA